MDKEHRWGEILKTIQVLSRARILLSGAKKYADWIDDHLSEDPEDIYEDAQDWVDMVEDMFASLQRRLEEVIELAEEARALVPR